MACHKENDIEINNLDSYFKPSYNQWAKACREMHVDDLKDFKKISLQRKMFLKYEKEISK